MSIIEKVKNAVKKTEREPEDADVLVMRDTKKPLKERKEAFSRVMDKMMNPMPEGDFDPETFDPMEDHPDMEVAKRTRTEPPRRLPRMGMFPKALLEGQMVGMFESKQDLYLLIAWLSERLSDVEDQLEAKNGDKNPAKRD